MLWLQKARISELILLKQCFEVSEEWSRDLSLGLSEKGEVCKTGSRWLPSGFPPLDCILLFSSLGYRYHYGFVEHPYKRRIPVEKWLGGVIWLLRLCWIFEILWVVSFTLAAENVAQVARVVMISIFPRNGTRGLEDLAVSNVIAKLQRWGRSNLETVEAGLQHTLSFFPQLKVLERRFWTRMARVRGVKAFFNLLVFWDRDSDYLPQELQNGKDLWLNPCALLDVDAWGNGVGTTQLCLRQSDVLEYYRVQALGCSSDAEVLDLQTQIVFQPAK